jgi:hypothetical protein
MKTNSKAKKVLNIIFTAALLLATTHAAFAQEVPPIHGLEPAPVAAPAQPSGPVPGQTISPDDMAAQTQFCQYQYQWVCNAWGQCMYKYVWVCF